MYNNKLLEIFISTTNINLTVNIIMSIKICKFNKQHDLLNIHKYFTFLNI